MSGGEGSASGANRPGTVTGSPYINRDERLQPESAFSRREEATVAEESAEESGSQNSAVSNRGVCVSG